MKKILNFLKTIWRWDTFWFYMILMIAGLPIMLICFALKLNDWATAGVLVVIWSPFIVFRILKDLKEERKNDKEDIIKYEMEEIEFWNDRETPKP